MKRILLAVILLACVGSAWGYDANTISVLELENNITDSIGNTWVAWTYSSSAPFSSAIKKFGSYSAGPVTNTASLYETQTGVYSTAECWFYLPSGLGNSNGYVILGVGVVAILQTGTALLTIQVTGKTAYTETILKDTWYHLAITYNPTGTLITSYLNGVMVDQQESSRVWNNIRFFNNAAGTAFYRGYIDRIVLSDIIRTSFPSDDPFTPTPTVTPTYTVTPTITPTSTPTYTPTVTPTITPTATPTFTVTRTYTPTATPTKSSPIILTVTPNITPWWWWWSQKQRGVSLCKLLP